MPTPILEALRHFRQKLVKNPVMIDTNEDRKLQEGCRGSSNSHKIKLINALSPVVQYENVQKSNLTDEWMEHILNESYVSWDV